MLFDALLYVYSCYEIISDLPHTTFVYGFILVTYIFMMYSCNRYSLCCKVLKIPACLKRARENALLLSAHEIAEKMDIIVVARLPIDI